MILRLPVPEGWTTQAGPEGLVHSRGPITIRALPIRELPVSAVAWMRSAALQGAPIGTAFTLRSHAELTTVDGWPAGLLEAELAGPELREVRMVAFYQFADYAAGAILRAEPAAFAAERDALVDLLGRARPDWGPQESVCLARVFAGVVVAPAMAPALEAGNEGG